jgi:histidinol-phosphatase
MDYHQELKIALEAVRAAGEIQLRHRQSILNVTIKSDYSPVTDVDALCENQIRDRLLTAFPSDGFLGEETGEEQGASGRRWIVDPLDGTRPYIRGIPTHSSLIALEDENSIVVGCMNLPAMHEIYWASHGNGAFCNGTALHVSTISTLKESLGSAFGYVQKSGSREATNLLSLMNQLGYVYGFMDAYTYGCIASGRIDACVNLLDKPWDCAAAACIVREAGGRFTDMQGAKSVHNGSCILSNGLVHEEVLKYFQ